MQVIVVASAKGGVAKTTTAVALAAALGEHRATLLVDFDPQGQCALWFGYDPRGGVYDWLGAGESLEYASVAGRPGSYLWLLPGDSRTKAVEKLYGNGSEAEMVGLVERIRRLREDFHYVVVDTAPSGVLQEVALRAADEVVIPFRCEAPGVDGADGTVAMLKKLGCQARLTFLPVDFYVGVNDQKRNLLDFSERKGIEVIADFIPHRVAVAEAVAEGKTIWEYRGRGIEDVQRAYRALLDRLLDGDAVAWVHVGDEKYLAGYPHD